GTVEADQRRQRPIGERAGLLPRLRERAAELRRPFAEPLTRDEEAAMPGPEIFRATLSHQDWSLHRRAHVDEARHREKLKEAIRDHLPDIVSDGAIITSDGQKIVRVPIRGLELPHFRYAEGGQKHAGQGDGSSAVGDVLGPGPGGQQGGRPGSGKGRGAGDQPGVDYY